MEFEDFCERLARCTDKWEERKLIDSQEWKDPRIKVYLSTVFESFDYKPTIGECLEQLNGNNPEWTFLMAMSDWENKSIELENTLNKSLAKSEGIKRQTITALLGEINPRGANIPQHQIDIKDLVNSDDQILNLYALEQLETIELPDLLQYESFIEKCLKSKNTSLANAALKVLMRTENEDADIIADYKQKIMKQDDTNREMPKIVSISQVELTGDWVPVNAAIRQNHEMKKSIFAGHS